MFALSKWTGAASESLVPYSNNSSINPAYAYQDVAHMQNARFVNTADVTSVKNLIMEYGSVSTAIYYHPTFQNDNGAYLFPYTGYSTNHIVNIVGWDDNYSLQQFPGLYMGDGLSAQIPTALGSSKTAMEVIRGIRDIFISPMRIFLFSRQAATI